MSGLTFQCLTPSGIELHDIVSSVGTLTVLPSQTEGEQLQGNIIIVMILNFTVIVLILIIQSQLYKT